MPWAFSCVRPPARNHAETQLLTGHFSRAAGYFLPSLGDLNGKHSKLGPIGILGLSLTQHHGRLIFCCTARILEDQADGSSPRCADGCLVSVSSCGRIATTSRFIFAGCEPGSKIVGPAGGYANW